MATENLGGISYTVDADTGKLISAQSAVTKATKSMEGDFKGLDTQVKKSQKEMEKAFAAQTRSLGQAGVQIQQLVGQLQQGTSAAVAFAQQGADLGIVLGAPLVGVMVSLAAVLGGVFASAMGGAADNTEELTEKLKELVKVSTLTEEQASVLSSAEKDNIKEKEKLVEAIKRELEIQERALKVNRQNQQFLIDSGKSAAVYADEEEKLTREVNQRRAAIQLANSEIENSKSNIELYASLVGDAAVQTQNQKDAVVELIASARFQAETFGKSAREIAVYVATINNATETQIEAVNATYDVIESKEAEVAARKKNEQTLLDELAAEKKALNERLAAQEKAQKEQDAKERRAKSKRESETKAAEGFATGIIRSGETEPQRLAREEAELEELRAQGLLNDELYQKAKTEIVKQQEEERQRATTASQQAILTSSAAFFDSAAGIALAASDEQSGVYKTLFAISKGFAIANAALNLQTAISNASALPWPANIPAIAQAAAQGATIASSLASLTYSGSRQYGGPTNAGGIYKFGEQNQPEVLREGGESYLLPGNRGNITPLSGGGGTSVVNQINVPPGYTATESQRTSADGMTTENVINIVEAQTLNSGSRTNQNIRNSNTTSTRLGGGGRRQ